MLDLTPEEARRLRRLADQIAAQTQDRAYWLIGVRHTCLALLAEVSAWLGDGCARRRPGLGTGCVRPSAHPGSCLDAFGHAWTHDPDGSTAP
ncbi:hypothetical protein [Actinorugispora endophytica]|uniref:Uncharacterized protein n=1 Tax=Actinorugispora endophytica TaxID=1605990 RepID=A0A4R6USI3_9ACTN|nr:hypothetical protein [Actinorugispora endophytica]TDQ46324.1 hypothetical protein EV190_12511 [Actinorugispora endophytica]